MKTFHYVGFGVLMALMAACGSPAATSAPQAAPTAAPAVANVVEPAGAVTAAKPVFIDFYAPW